MNAINFIRKSFRVLVLWRCTAPVSYTHLQVGGYAHGTFKDVSPEQAERITAHPKVKATGARKVIGISAEGVCAKIPAEISYMDANCTKWSYACLLYTSGVVFKIGQITVVI